jgi:hypothetical protein
MTPALCDFTLFVRPPRLDLFHFSALCDFTVAILGDGGFQEGSPLFSIKNEEKFGSKYPPFPENEENSS